MLLEEVMADGRGWNGDAGGPLLDESVDVEEAVVAGGFEVFRELSCGEDRGASRGASGRTAQTAATQGRLVRMCHSWARSNHWQGRSRLRSVRGIRGRAERDRR